MFALGSVQSVPANGPIVFGASYPHRVYYVIRFVWLSLIGVCHVVTAARIPVGVSGAKPTAV